MQRRRALPRHDPTCRRRPDASTLAELGASTFTETFAEANTPEDFAAYMAAAFGEAIQRAELEDATRPCSSPSATAKRSATSWCARDGRRRAWRCDDALEIARLYARRATLGTGVGATLMQRALAEAAGRGKDVVWLGVWERNARAIRFYEAWDFHPDGDAALPARHRPADRPRHGATYRPGVLTCGTP